MKMKCSKGNFGLNKLVYVEEYSDIDKAIQREKDLKEAPRSFKQKLLRFYNPTWVCIQDYWKENMERALIKA